MPESPAAPPPPAPPPPARRKWKARDVRLVLYLLVLLGVAAWKFSWIDDLATSADLGENLRNGSVIPLRAILTNHGGPRMNSHFNLYYLHWWTLTHFVFESPQHRAQALDLVRQGGSLEAFEKTLGPVDQVQAEWHAYVRHLKAQLAGTEPTPPRPGKALEATNAPALKAPRALGPG